MVSSEHPFGANVFFFLSRGFSPPSLARRAQQFLRTRRVTDTRMTSRFTLSRSTPLGAPARFIWTDGGRHERGTRLDGGHIYNRSHASYEIQSNDKNSIAHAPPSPHTNAGTSSSSLPPGPTSTLRKTRDPRPATGTRRRNTAETPTTMPRPRRNQPAANRRRRSASRPSSPTLGATRRSLRTSICWSRSRSDYSARCFARYPARRASAAAAAALRWVRGEKQFSRVSSLWRFARCRRSARPSRRSRCAASRSCPP